MWITPVAATAADSATFTNDITDTQNLLGGNVSRVTDAMKRTEEETGVHVRLQYVDSFDTDRKATEWACDALEDTDPKPNTVLLAVASGDGSLAVCVSSNSDEWLHDQKTVNALSEAAMQPLTKQGKQDWAGAATAMMDEIAQQKRTSTTSRTMRIGVVAMGGVLIVLVAVIVVAVVVRRRREVARDAASQEPASTNGTPQDGTPSDPSDASPSAAARAARPMTRRELREARRRKKGPFRR